MRTRRTGISPLIKKIVLASVPSRVVGALVAVRDIPKRFMAIDDKLQHLLRLHYMSVSEATDAKTALLRSEFKVFSQHGEDGILLYIFSRIGTTNRRFVEFGVEDGRQCNTANLSLNHGWNGLLLDGSEENVARGRRYYDERIEPDPSLVNIVQCFVTAENIEQVLSENGIKGEIDLLSIDIDGNDYWVWKAITEVKPRVVVMEYNASFGPERSMTVKYDPAFDRHQKHPSGMYHGASLAALAKLGHAKGYDLVGCDSKGVNAFFVRHDVAEGRIDPIPVQEAYYLIACRLKLCSPAEQFQRIRHLEFESV